MKNINIDKLVAELVAAGLNIVLDGSEELSNLESPEKTDKDKFYIFAMGVVLFWFQKTGIENLKEEVQTIQSEFLDCSVRTFKLFNRGRVDQSQEERFHRIIEEAIPKGILEYAQRISAVFSEENEDERQNLIYMTSVLTVSEICESSAVWAAENFEEVEEPIIFKAVNLFARLIFGGHDQVKAVLSENLR